MAKKLPDLPESPLWTVSPESPLLYGNPAIAPQTRRFPQPMNPPVPPKRPAVEGESVCADPNPPVSRWCRRHGLGGVFIPGALVLAMGCANSHFWGEMPTANALRPNAQDAPPAVAPQQADEHGMRRIRRQLPRCSQRSIRRHRSSQLQHSVLRNIRRSWRRQSHRSAPEEQTPPRPTQSPASLLAPTPAPRAPAGATGVGRAATSRGAIAAPG